MLYLTPCDLQHYLVLLNMKCYRVGNEESGLAVSWMQNQVLLGSGGIHSSPLWCDFLPELAQEVRAELEANGLREIRWHAPPHKKDFHQCPQAKID